MDKCVLPGLDAGSCHTDPMQVIVTNPRPHAVQLCYTIGAHGSVHAYKLSKAVQRKQQREQHT